MAAFNIKHIGALVNLRLYPENILGSGYKLVTILGILDHVDAVRYIDAAVLHASVYPTLPEGTADDYTSYSYLKLKTQSGDTTVVGMPWVNTIENVSKSKVQFTIDDMDADKVQLLTRTLNSMNIFGIEIKYL